MDELLCNFFLPLHFITFLISMFLKHVHLNAPRNLYRDSSEILSTRSLGILADVEDALITIILKSTGVPKKWPSSFEHFL